MSEEMTPPEAETPREVSPGEAQPDVVKVNVVDRTETILDPDMDLIEKVGTMARICYRTEVQDGVDPTELNKRIIRKCIESGHESVLEHGAISVYLPVEEVHDSWKVMEKLTGQKGHRVDFRRAWENSVVDAQAHYLYPFSDPEIDSKNTARRGLQPPQDGAYRILPCVTGNIRAWRTAIRQKLFLAVNIRHDPLLFVITARVLQALNEVEPVFFEDIVAEMAKLRQSVKEFDDRDPIKQLVMSKIPAETEDVNVLNEIVNAFFNIPTDIFAEKAAACATLSVILRTDRGTTHQLVRHRRDVGYSQESQRYVNYDKKGYQVVPPTVESSKKWAARKFIDNYDLGTLRPDSKPYKLWYKTVLNAFQGYHDLINMRICGGVDGDAEPLRLPPETCRGVLPNDCATRIGITFLLHDGYTNFNHWRIDHHAQFAIRSTFARILVRGINEGHPYFNIIDPNILNAWIGWARDQKLFENQKDTVDAASLRQQKRIEAIEKYRAEQFEMIKRMKARNEAEAKAALAAREKAHEGGHAADVEEPMGGTVVVGKEPADAIPPEQVTERPPTVDLIREKPDAEAQG